MAVGRRKQDAITNHDIKYRMGGGAGDDSESA